MAWKLIKLNRTKCCEGTKVVCGSREYANISMHCACMLSTYIDPMWSHVRTFNYIGLCRAWISGNNDCSDPSLLHNEYDSSYGCVLCYCVFHGRICYYAHEAADVCWMALVYQFINEAVEKEMYVHIDISGSLSLKVLCILLYICKGSPAINH